MAPRGDPGNQPWYRTPAAVFAAGGVGAVLITALVVTVVQMSDEWSKPLNTVLTTSVAPATTPTTRDRQQPFIITPSTTSTTFTTSVPLSTTEIGIPTAATTSGTDTTTTTTTPGSGPVPPPTVDMPTTFPSQRRPDDNADEPRTTRNRPRLNETRTLYP